MCFKFLNSGVWYTLDHYVTYCRAERRSAANGDRPAVNKLLSAYHRDNDSSEEKELTPAVQELCATIDAYIFVIDSSRALIEGQYIYTVCLSICDWACENQPCECKLH